MTELLPTFSSGSWTITDFRNSLVDELKNDQNGKKLRIFAYAVTVAGWDEIRSQVVKWKNRKKGRSVVAYVGTDHGLTQPEALKDMQQDGVDVHIMLNYDGIYHPKVVWLYGEEDNCLWVGSNNLTRDGLRNNIEFAVLVKFREQNDKLIKWHTAVIDASKLLDEQLLKNYESQRKKALREVLKKNKQIPSFVWKEREKNNDIQDTNTKKERCFIMEIMPKETGANGSQIQIPLDAVKPFFKFRLKKKGEKRKIKLLLKGSFRSRSLTMTCFDNSTVRLSIRELEFGDRPCVIVFYPRQDKDNAFEFDIIQKVVFPKRYNNLLEKCKNKTRLGSRRWGIVDISDE